MPTSPIIPAAAPDTAVGIAPSALEDAELTTLEPPETTVDPTPTAPDVIVDPTPPAPLVIFVATLPPPTTTVLKTDVTPEMTSVVKVE